MRPLPFAFALSLACATVASPTTAQAHLPDDDGPPLIGPRYERLDAAREIWSERVDRASLWVALQADARRGPARDAWGAFVLVNVPLERLAARRNVITEGPQPELKPPPRPPKSATPTEPPAPKIEPESAMVDAAPAVPIVVTPAVARRAVKAALRAAHLDAPDAVLDRLAARARQSALLPELRLRASRIVDESQNLAPTEYDPARVTSAGGTTMWLEARATWRLDRLVFADDEIAIERLRDERAEAQRKLAARVLETLVLWQRALAAESDGRASADEHQQAVLKVIEAEAILDVLTDGWFTRWRRPSSRAPP